MNFDQAGARRELRAEQDFGQLSGLGAAAQASAKDSTSLVIYAVPSVRDIVFIFLLWALLAGSLSSRPLADPDIGWHIRNGELMLASHAITRTDPFSSTMEGWIVGAASTVLLGCAR
jgi:hypothetical protein